LYKFESASTQAEAEFISEKISAEYDGWKSKSEIHGEAYRKRHPKPSHEGEKG